MTVTLTKPAPATIMATALSAVSPAVLKFILPFCTRETTKQITDAKATERRYHVIGSLTRYAVTADVCGNCLISMMNCDESGLTDDDMEPWSLLTGHWTTQDDGYELGFCHRNCEACGELPGDRYRMIQLP